ncbi:MAG: hypothetical protein ACRD2C_27160 [Acidimicrobiales bacterium]
MGTTTETHDVTASLHGRARRLRQQAASLTPLLAETYRRRAAELDVQAWLEAVWNPPLDLRAALGPQAA